MVSIHAPVKVRTLRKLGKEANDIVSIHAPVKVRTCKTHWVSSIG